MRLTIGSILLCRYGWAQVRHVNRGKLAKSVFSKQGKSGSNKKAFVQEGALIQFLQGQNVFVNFSVFQTQERNCRVFYKLADIQVSFKINQGIMRMKDKKHQVLAFRRKPKKLMLFNRNKQLTALKQRKKETIKMVNLICDQILSENIYKNINHTN